MQDRRAVRIHHAFRRPVYARVAHRDRVVFVVRRVRKIVLRTQQRFVVLVPALHAAAAEGKDDDALEPVQRRELPVERQQDVIDHEEAVLACLAIQPISSARGAVQGVHDAPAAGIPK